MKTSKAFSTISYNSDTFLTATLERLVKSRKIDFFAYVEHFPEDDETKRHKHVYIVPNGKTDTDQIRNELCEIDIENPLKPPLGCQPCRSSKFADWYLYSKHDRVYLASKGQSRKYNYSQTDFVVSDRDYFVEEIHMIDLTKYTRYAEMLKSLEEGKSFADFLSTGIVPIQQTYAYERAYFILQEANTERSGRNTHTPKIDTDTGEVVEPVATETTEPQRATESHRERQKATESHRETQRATESRRKQQRAVDSNSERRRAWHELYKECDPEGEDLPY